ncbi:hypothetical protein [Mycolicibacterium llatzerense]|uniref:hypothetical protein n=1 Tax=Mycolicibacterium llatzerense TaxID=280871 RepID=UPI0013A6931F|nr:hypothetical protein [Mycolicibacterium llatzerense]
MAAKFLKVGGALLIAAGTALAVSAAQVPTAKAFIWPGGLLIGGVALLLIARSRYGTVPPVFGSTDRRSATAAVMSAAVLAIFGCGGIYALTTESTADRSVLVATVFAFIIAAYCLAGAVRGRRTETRGEDDRRRH